MCIFVDMPMGKGDILLATLLGNLYLSIFWLCWIVVTWYPLIIYGLKYSKICPNCVFMFSRFELKTIQCVWCTVIHRRVARNSQWGGLFWGSGGGAPSRRRPMGVWGRSPQPPEAGGLGAKPPAAGGTGVWGRSPQRSKILHFFCKNNFILGLFWLKNNAFKTWLRNWQCKQD